MTRKTILTFLVIFLAAGVVNTLSEADELKVGAVEVKTARGVEVKGTGLFDSEVLELERVEGPPVSVRFDRIHRLVFKEVTRVERSKDSLRVAFYHLERVGGGSGIDGFIRASRPVTFRIRNKEGVKRFEIGPGNPVEQVVFTGNMNRFRKGLDAEKDPKDFVLGRASKESIIVVPGNTRWLRTGIHLAKDQHVHFTVTGTIKWGNDPMGKQVGPDGQPHSGRQGRPLPGRNLGMLIAMINPVVDKAYGIGSANDFKTPANGELELGINDDEPEDNTGNFRVRIVVDPI